MTFNSLKGKEYGKGQSVEGGLSLGKYSAIGFVVAAHWQTSSPCFPGEMESRGTARGSHLRRIGFGVACLWWASFSGGVVNFQRSEVKGQTPCDGWQTTDTIDPRSRKKGKV